LSRSEALRAALRRTSAKPWDQAGYLTNVPRRRLQRDAGAEPDLQRRCDPCPTITSPTTPAERLIRSLGNHLTLIETHAAQCRRQLAELALALEGLRLSREILTGV
jgi:hypothetical protein